jgi:hypothetical protein
MHNVMPGAGLTQPTWGAFRDPVGFCASDAVRQLPMIRLFAFLLAALSVDGRQTKPSASDLHDLRHLTYALSRVGICRETGESSKQAGYRGKVRAAVDPAAHDPTRPLAASRTIQASPRPAGPRASARRATAAEDSGHSPAPMTQHMIANGTRAMHGCRSLVYSVAMATIPGEGPSGTQSMFDRVGLRYHRMLS